MWADYGLAFSLWHLTYENAVERESQNVSGFTLYNFITKNCKGGRVSFFINKPPLHYSSFFLTLRLRAPGDEAEQSFGMWIENVETSNTTGGKGRINIGKGERSSETESAFAVVRLGSAWSGFKSSLLKTQRGGEGRILLLSRQRYLDRGNSLHRESMLSQLDTVQYKYYTFKAGIRFIQICLVGSSTASKTQNLRARYLHNCTAITLIEASICTHRNPSC